MSEHSLQGPARPLRCALPWLLAGLLLAGVGVPAVGGAFGHVPSIPLVGFARPEANSTVTVNMTDQPRYSPTYLSIPEGTNVTFHLVNLGVFVHTFTLLAHPDVVLNTSWTPTQVDQYVNQTGSLANVSVAAGTSANTTVGFNRSTGFDSFEFLSVVPYQFQAGMYGFVNVTSTGPGVMVQEGTIGLPNVAFDPDVLAVNSTHYPVVVNVLVTNEGTTPHTFTVVPQSNVTLTPSNFTAYFTAHAPLANVNVPASTGGTVWANFTVSAVGVYQYLCEIPGHFAAGMDGLLYVGIAPPPVPAAPSTAIVEVWVLFGSAGLLGVGAVLAAIASFSGRFPAPPKSPGHGH